MKVLVVDDEPQIRRALRTSLEAHGYEVATVGTGEEGVVASADQQPDLVLLDLGLPDMDGTEAARILGDGARTAAIPVVALSAVALDGDIAWLTRAGFAGYIEKPIDVESFPYQVRRFCT